MQPNSITDAISDLQARMQLVEESVAASPKADYFEVVKARELVQAMTRAIFQSDCRIEDSDDPEIPGVRYFMVHVKTTGTRDEVRNRWRKWHSQLSCLPTNTRRLFRLSVDAS